MFPGTAVFRAAAAATALRRPAAAVLDLRCACCRTPWAGDEAWPLCAGCRAQLRPPRAARRIAGVDEVVVAWEYAAVARALIVEAKEAPHGAAAHALARLAGGRVAAGIARRGGRTCWTPPSRRRRLRRWYLPALLARAWAREAGARSGALLKRRRERPPQAALGGAARRANVRGSFAPRRCARRAPPAVWVVDDVVTTGSTLAEAARCLRAAGAQRVYAACLASAGEGAAEDRG